MRKDFLHGLDVTYLSLCLRTWLDLAPYFRRLLVGRRAKSLATTLDTNYSFV